MKRILVIDDDEDILSIVSSLLQFHGFEVKTYSTGFNVSNVVVDYDPNLILMDIKLPGKLGTEVCKELKQSYSHLPIILFSAHAQKEQAIAICQADDFIKKPFDIKDLIGTINSHLN